MLQCCSVQSKTPYYIGALDKNVYSLEEINYFIYNHMNLVYREFFCEQLYEYIEKDLMQSELAGELRELEEKGGQIQDFIMCILKGSYYYSAGDMAAAAPLITSINNMTRAERMTLEAESMLRQKRYESALHIYFDILNNMEEDGENKAFYARIAFSIGIIYARLFMSRNANTYFAYAYELFPDPAYAKACVYMSIINNDDEELLRTIIKYKVSDDALQTIRKRIDSIRRQIRKSPEMQDFMYDARNVSGFENVVANFKREYYTILS